MIDESKLSRRSFLKWSAAGAAIATSGLACAGKSLNSRASSDEPQAPLSGGEWKTAVCWSGCGGGCINQVYVKDGIVLRHRTDESHADSVEYPQQRGCIKGRSNRHSVFAVDRLKYPMKRKNWNPGGENVNGHLRGKDEWVRISWTEALDILASETTRIKNKHTNKAILNISAQWDIPAFNYYGGTVSMWGQQSQGGFPVVSTAMRGTWNDDMHSAADRMTMYNNSKLVVFWGLNPSWSTLGIPSYMFRALREKGVKFISVDPWFNPSASALIDEWIPVRPGTDVALLLAVAYEMIKNNWHDQAFLDKYTIGFDSAHMPTGANKNDNFKDYVLGTFDRIPKTPEWASEMCGTPVAAIRSLARQIGTVKPASLRSGIAAGRTSNGGVYAQAWYTIGLMTGSIGKAGGECVAYAGGGTGTAIFNGPELIKLGSKGFPKHPKNDICETPRGGGKISKGNFEDGRYYGVGYSEAWTSVVRGTHTHFTDGKDYPIDIRMIIKLNEGSRMNQLTNPFEAIKAFRKVEFVAACDFFMTPDCTYADLVLPSMMHWEREGYSFRSGTGNREMQAMITGRITEPKFEVREDEWIEAELLKRWGLDPSVLSIPAKQQMFNMISGTQVINDDGKSYENLVSVTEDDIKKAGVTGKAQAGRIPYQEFAKKGWYQVPRKFNDNFGHVPYQAYIEGKEELPTQSGKFEIYCQRLVDVYNVYGLSKIAPIAKYTAPEGGYEATFRNWKNKTKGEFPFQLINIHHIRRTHSNLDNVAQLREIFEDTVYMNPLDAQKLGLKHQDYILVSTPAGKVLRRASVTATIVPGVVGLTEGPWFAPDEETGIDHSGNPNTLYVDLMVGEGQQAYNTAVCKVEKYTGSTPTPDYLWAPRMPKMA